jgi:hypothetical protein
LVIRSLSTSNTRSVLELAFFRTPRSVFR